MRILVIHGPNLNLLGKREPGTYGTTTLADINQNLHDLGQGLGVDVESFQSNIEGELVNAIHKAADSGINGIIINPGAYGHTSIALRDAFLAVHIPFVEVHISNIYAREEFRHKTYLSDIAAGIITGFGPKGYMLALSGLMQILTSTSQQK